MLIWNSIWIAKLAVWEFLRRLTRTYWKQNYNLALRLIRVCLGLTFCAVVLSTITECSPIVDYWQVLPDPGPACRQGYAHLITMGAADILTDILLIVFPIPIVIFSTMALKRKVWLSLLFSLSIVLIIITAIRVPLVIQRKGSQQYRSLWASSEILAAAAISNSLVLGSFIRNKGIKKKRHRSEIFASTTTINTQQSIGADTCKRTSVTRMKFGSDDDLIQSFGYRLNSDAELKELKMAKRPDRRRDTNTTLAEHESKVEERKIMNGTPVPMMRDSRSKSSLISEREGYNSKVWSVEFGQIKSAHWSYSSSLSQNSTLYDLSAEIESGRKLSSSSAVLSGAGTIIQNNPSCQVQNSDSHHGRSISFANHEDWYRAPLCRDTGHAEKPKSISGRTTRPMLKQRDSGRGFMEYDFAIAEDQEEDAITNSRPSAADCVDLLDVSPRSSMRHFSRNCVNLPDELHAQGEFATHTPCRNVEQRWSDWTFSRDRVGEGTTR